LKNFGIVYDDVQGEARPAPVYDLVTTSVYLPTDSMALTLNGSTHWPSNKALQRLGETRMGGSPARINAILERIADAMSEVAAGMRQYMKTHPGFAQVGSQMLAEWQVGVEFSIRGRAQSMG
jgi:serine/threonine-protein kinase HipA